jgi:indolepyruvate ferredoxin oxidoreductase alpha subunit
VINSCMKSEVLLGDEAVAIGAVHAGVSAAFSYPGTPASEIMEYLVRDSRISGDYKASWCINEKVAYEEALGVSYAGKRALVSMKHVGLNVAADPFMNSSLTGIKGGLVVVVADDPGMHSSQNEQDSRYYAEFARIICLEPSDHQEAYAAARHAFDISEQFNIPVMIRMVTRLSHSRSQVSPDDPRGQNPLGVGDSRDWTLLPVNARRRFKKLIDMQPDFLELSEGSDFNRLTLEPENRSLGVIASGIAFNYVRENMQDMDPVPSLLKLSMYPLPFSLIRRLKEHVGTLVVLEDGYPFIETRLRGLFGIEGKTILGKLEGTVPATGELQPHLVRQALGLAAHPQIRNMDFPLSGRPPQLCQGCPHADTFHALNQALEDFPEAQVFSDIGCYTLGALPPYQAVDTCVCMGASVSMAKGGADAGIYPSVAVIGDSTFAHSGITPLLDAAASQTDMTLIIVDNASVAMTGGQPTFLSGDELLQIVRGTGVSAKHIRLLTPLPKNLQENTRVLKEEIAFRGLSVVVSMRECVQETRKRSKQKGAR